MPDEFALADAIEAVRSELRRVQDAGRGSDVRFVVGPAEVEFTVEVVKGAGGEASVRVLNILSLGGTGEVSTGKINRVKLVLTPVEVGGAPFVVASVQARRPDRTADAEMDRGGDPASADRPAAPLDEPP
jgi:Trypsin-co-occurring domain 2